MSLFIVICVQLLIKFSIESQNSFALISFEAINCKLFWKLLKIVISLWIVWITFCEKFCFSPNYLDFLFISTKIFIIFTIKPLFAKYLTISYNTSVECIENLIIRYFKQKIILLSINRVLWLLVVCRALSCRYLRAVLILCSALNK